MSVPLIDFRGKVTPETDAVLDALSRSSGRDKSEIAREWLHKMAVAEIEKTIALHKVLSREGMLAAYGGGPAR